MFFIFDWDGTISDSADKIVGCMQAAARDLDMEVLNHDTVKNIIGLGLPEAIRNLYPSIKEGDIPNFSNAYSTHFRRQDQTPSKFFPGVMQTLNALQAKDFKLAVATGKSRKGLDRVLGNLDLQGFFHHSRCADETASKPDPLMLQQLVDEAGVRIEEAVMVGDTEWDMCMADNCGMKKIAVSYGAHSSERLMACKPDLLVNDFNEILNWQFD